MELIDLFGQTTTVKTKQDKANDERVIDLRLEQLGINNPNTWTIETKEKMVELILEAEYESLIDEAREYAMIQKKYGSILSKRVGIQQQLDFVEFICWMNGLMKAELSFDAIVCYQDINPKNIRFDLMEKFGADAEKALRLFNKSQEIMGMESV